MTQEIHRKKSKEASKQKLLDAAMSVFSEKGYDAATTKMIASVAGINESLINRYFGGKHGLLAAIVQYVTEDEQKNPVIYKEGATLEEEIYNFLESWHSRMMEKEKYIRLIFSRALIDPEIAKVLNKGIDCKIGMPQLYERLLIWKEKGWIDKNLNLESVSMAISAYSFTQSFLAVTLIKMDDASILELMKDFTKNIVRGIAPRQSK